MDPTSFANITHVETCSYDISWRVDFDRKILHGHVDLSLKARQATQEIVLDTRSLVVEKVIDVRNGQVLVHELKPEHEVFGSALHVALSEELPPGSVIVIRVVYETSSHSTAIQWLDPSQTSGKRHPYLFTQCQAIHARSLIPCQDTPAIKAPYTATVSVPKELTALMSAVVQAKSATADTGDDSFMTYAFLQKVAIPAYLFALVVGDLVARKIGPRSSVWSEPSQVEAGVFEFSDTESFIAAGEKLLGEYVWGSYDILLLPPSFPYGGMENPCLTFVTPTLIAGDKSLANVVAHEIAHSWMGNLVTNKYWSDFWLNEGHTVYVERRILGALYGEPFRQFHAMLGRKGLEEDVKRLGKDHPFTHLVPSLEGIDPDDVFSRVPYEKGFSFLYYLEVLVGGPEAMGQYLKAYVEEFRFKSITSADMKDFFLAYHDGRIDASKLASIDWDAWFNAPGPPAVENVFDRTLEESCQGLSDKWCENEHGFAQASLCDLEGMRTEQIVHFLNCIGDKGVSADVLKAMESIYQFNSSQNAEIRFAWSKVCIASGYTEAFPSIAEFLGSQGRMKFVRPLFRELFASATGKELAVSTFAKFRDTYHPIATKMIAKDLLMA